MTTVMIHPASYENVRHAVVPFVAGELEHGSLCTPQWILKRPGAFERRRVRHRQSVVDGVGVEPGRNVDALERLDRGSRERTVGGRGRAHAVAFLGDDRCHTGREVAEVVGVGEFARVSRVCQSCGGCQSCQVARVVEVGFFTMVLLSFPNYLFAVFSFRYPFSYLSIFVLDVPCDFS